MSDSSTNSKLAPLRATLVAAVLLAIGPGIVRAVETTPPFWIVSSRDCNQRTDGWCERSCPRVYFKPCGGRLGEVHPMSLAASMRPGAPVVIFVHGSFLDWEDTLQRANDTFTWLETSRDPAGPRPHYVIMTWPSDPITLVLPTVDVNLLGRRASLNGYYLARVVNDLPSGTNVTLIGHSHGTRVVGGALHVLAGGHLWDHGIPRDHLRPHHVRTVFAAAAMDHHWMNPGERYGRAWFATDGLVHLRNERDAALDLYPLRRPFSQRALGQVGFAARSLVPYGPATAGLVEVDVAPLVGDGHMWFHYTNRTEIARYLAPYVFHEVPYVAATPQ